MEKLKEALVSFFILSLLFGACVKKNEKNERKDFAEIVYKALKEGQKKIDIPKGTYYMFTEDIKPLTLDSLKDIEINANGSEVITMRPSRAIQISNCENVKISGFSIDCDTLPFTQGKIVAIDSVKRMWWEVEIMGGYPLGRLGSVLPGFVQIFDPNTNQLKKNLYTYFTGIWDKIEKVGERRFRFEKKQYNPDSNEALGDLVVIGLNYEGTKPHTIVTSRSKNIQFEDVTIYSGNFVGFYELECEKNSYNRCKVIKKLDDPKVSYPRLVSINRDAINSRSAKIGPKITNCTLMDNGDDDIAIHTTFYKVLNNKGDIIDLAARFPGIQMAPGNMLRFVSYDGRVIGDAKVLKIEQISDYPQAKHKRLTEKLSKMYEKSSIYGSETPFITRLTLDRKLTVATGDVVYSLDMSGSGFVVKNNKIGNTRARGLLIKSSDGIISDNEITGCELCGISIAPEFWFMEAGLARNLIIENNTIKDCMFANSNYGIEQAAPLSVIFTNGKNQIAPSGGFKNIIIKNNNIENSTIPAIIVTSADSVQITGNQITISKAIVRAHGEKYGINNKKPIYTKNVDHLVIEGNNIK